MYTTPADAGAFQFAWPEWVDYDYSNWTTGEYNSLGMAATGQYSAPAYCAALVAHGKSDWYLPAPNEMSVLGTYRAAIGGFRPDGNNEAPYWTGAEAGENRAWYQYAEVPSWTGWTSKGISLWVRCVRKD
jgi:hypothetical protein